MSILINCVRISGFRGIENFEISLPKSAVLIGLNNAGKTSILKALQLALGDYSRSLTDEDFYVDISDKVVSKIVIDIRIVPTDTQNFKDNWLEVFQDLVKFDADGNSFVAIRTISEKDEISGMYKTTRYPLSSWDNFENWINTDMGSKITFNKEEIPFIYIDPQRDIHKELSEKKSYVGKILSEINFDESSTKEIERLILNLNMETINKSAVLQDLKRHLNSLSNSFNSKQHTEITAFPKKIRDLSKYFSIHFGENESNSFSMEYHGMGTRSWASMLTLKAFIDITEKKYAEDEKVFFPIIAAEEPEAHLHPNAQKVLYSQLATIKGQTIITSHSPYLAVECGLNNLRSIRNTSQGAIVDSMEGIFNKQELKELNRTIMLSRGEVIFSKVLILFEGATEAQLAPVFFEKYFDMLPYYMGVNCIAVGGKQYSPFIKLAYCLGIKVCIISDNDGKAQKNINKKIKDIEQELTKKLPKECKLSKDIFSIQYLHDGNDMEIELLEEVRITEELKEALLRLNTAKQDTTNERYTNVLREKIWKYNNDELKEKLKCLKTDYSAFLADVIRESTKAKEDLIPEAFLETCKIIEQWSKTW